MKYFQRNLWLIALLAVSTSLWAQDQTKEERRAKHKAFRAEMKAYHQANVLPVLKAQRQKLDAVMSADDRQKVSDLRAQKKTAREKMRAQRKEFRKNHKKGERPELTDAQKQARKEQHKARRQARTAAWEIADKYETTIEKLMAEMKPQHEQWRKDLKAIRVKHFGEHKKGEHPRMGKKGKGHPRHGKRHHGKRMRGMRMLSHPLAFLMFDPAKPEKADDKGKATSVIYPNPSSSASSIEYSLIKSENVNIQLVDANGKLVKQVLNTTKSAGNHSQTIDMEGLKTGTYYLRIKTSAGTETKRIIKR